jgi:mannose-6-phosphate isomerase-like protein (cupin superfamily)
MTHEPIDVHTLAAQRVERWSNQAVARANDHVVRVRVMTEPFYWHLHPDSDEVFLVLEGALRVELPDETIDLGEGQLLAVPAGTPHRTSPVGPRSVNLAFERAGATTTRVAEPAESEE